MSLKKKAVKGFFWTFLEKFSSKFISFSVSILLARLILPKEFGLLGLIYLFTGISTVLINSGLSNSLIRSKNLRNDDYSTVFYFNILLSFLIYTLLFFTAPFIADYYEQDQLTLIIRLYTLTFIFDAFGSIQKTILTIELDFKRQMTVTLPALIISSCVSLIMAYLEYGVWSLVWGAITYSFIVSAQYWFYSNWRPNFVFNKTKFNRHFKFGYKLTLAGLVNIIFNNIYYIILGKYFSINQVGYYQRAESLKDMPVSSLSLVLDKVTFPIFSKMQDNPLQLKRAYQDIMQLVIFVIAPTMAILIVVSNTLFVTLYTEKWLPAAPLFQIMAIASILYPIQVYNVNILKVKGRSDLIFKVVLLVRLSSLALLYLAFDYGVYVLVFTQVIIAILFFLIYSFFSGRLINYSTWEQIKDIAPSILLTICMALGLHFLYINILHLNNILVLLITCVSGYGIYFILAKLFKMKSLGIIKNLILKR
ncbi:putative lipopolysaccharide biosynthesis protein [unidentified eubacterium SCB49]|nr:putative lipopolysaccharide biosynthesis protein [unidentified eubacterium SCB49]